MATALSLALKISADASAFRLDPVQRALVSLGDQTDKIAAQFDKFAASTPAAAKAQEDFAAQAQSLTNALRDGEITATQFAVQYERLGMAAKDAADVFAEGAAITERNRSAAERFDAAQASLKQKLDAGAISEQTYNRELERLGKGLTAAERAARGLAPAIDDAAKKGLKFNELSGVFSILPGPIGNVAGRLSGLSSAGEGLARVFSGGLQQGLTSIVGSVTALVNPFTLAAAAITGFASAASAVVSGLRSLEAETEKLQNAATKLGVSFAFIQTLQQAAEMSGVSFESVNGAMSRLLKTLAGADEESKQATAALNRLGISIDELNGKSTEDQVRLLGERLKNIEDPAKRAAAAMALFGKSGADILPFFDNLGIAEQTLNRFNARLSDLDVTRVLALGDSFDGVNASIKGISNELLTPFIGVTQSIADGLAAAFATFGKNVGVLLDILSPVTSAIGLFVNIILQVSSVLGNVIGGAFEPLAAICRVIAFVFDAMSRVVTEFWGRVNEAASAIRSFLQFNGSLEYMNELFSSLQEVVDRVATIISVAFSKSVEYVSALVKSFIEFTGLSGVIEYIGTLIGRVFGSVATVFSTIANAIGGAVGRLLTMAEKFLGIERPAKGASDAVGDAAAKTANLSKEQLKAIEAVNREMEKSQQGLNKAIESAGQYGQEGFNAALRYQESLKAINELAKEENYTAEQYARAVAQATREFETQMEVVKANAEEKKRIADEARRQAEENTRKVDALLAKANAIPEIEQSIAAVNAEIARVEAAQAAARAENDNRHAAELAARLADLDQLQARLTEQADQAGQGFADGYDKAFTETSKGISSLIDKAAEFGQAGIQAGMALQDSIAKAQAQVKDGILTKETYDREVERQKKLFNERVSGLQKAEQIAKNIEDRQQGLRDKQFEIDLERAEKLQYAKSGSVQIADIRNGGIAALFATLKEDPAVTEAKKQTSELQKISKEIAKLQAERVDILGGNG